MRMIDADVLIRMICGNECGCTPEECGIEEKKYDPAACNFRSYIAEMPTIEAEPVRHGRWIEKERYKLHGDEYCDCLCSECDHRITKPAGFYPNYCEDCGADMSGGAEND